MAQIKAILAEQSKSGGASTPYQTRISFSMAWQGNDPYTQEVAVEDATENSRVDLHPMATTLMQLTEDGVSALYIENNDGTFTANAVGGPPSIPMAMLATVEEVDPAPDQLPNTMILSKTSISLDNTTPSDTFTINGDYDGIVTVTSSNASVATVSLSGNVVTVTGVKSGTATITVSATGGNYTAASKTCSVTCSFIQDGEYGSKVISGTKTKGSTVKFDGIEWIVANVSGSTYTLMKKVISEKGTFGSSTTYSGSNAASWCSTFQNAMSANALSVVNSKTKQSVTAKVWLPLKSDVESWTDSSNPTSNDWYTMRKWTAGDSTDPTTSYGYWCCDPSGSSFVWNIRCNGGFGGDGPSYTRGFRPCIEVTQ